MGSSNTKSTVRPYSDAAESRVFRPTGCAAAPDDSGSHGYVSYQTRVAMPASNGPGRTVRGARSGQAGSERQAGRPLRVQPCLGRNPVTPASFVAPCTSTFSPTRGAVV